LARKNGALAGQVEATGSINATDLMPQLLADAGDTLTEVQRAVLLDGSLPRKVERLALGRTDG
jgi:hypothetical protein